MTDSSSFSSLLALVDSHLSKTSVSESRSDDASSSKRTPVPSLDGPLSDTQIPFFPSQRLPIPSFNLTGSPIQQVLAEQVANMLKAKVKERQQEEEKQRLVEEMKKIKLEEDKHVIDLMPALLSKEQMEICLRARKSQQEVSSIHSSLESLLEAKFMSFDEAPAISKSPEPLLPCKTDMSYILFQKVRKGKCSAFGKVLSSRLRPVAAPYLKEKIDSAIVRFDFKTMSPCDCIKEKLRRPTCNATYQPDILNFI